MKRDCAVAGLRIRGSVRVGREKGNREGSKVALSTRSYFKWRPLPNKARRIFFSNIAILVTRAVALKEWLSIPYPLSNNLVRCAWITFSV